MRRIVSVLSLVLLLGACGDRRNDDHTAAAAGSGSPAGERVLTTPEAAAASGAPSAQSSLPPATPPPSDPLCSEMTGAERDICLREAAERASRAPHEAPPPMEQPPAR